MDKIKGTVEFIQFRNEQNGFTVCQISVGKELVTATGIMPYTEPGEMIVAEGSYKVHPVFGEQFQIESFTKIMPEGTDAIYKYLASGAVKGIGPVSAEKIVDKFGEDTFDVLQNHPEWLSDIKGISPKKALQIGETFSRIFMSVRTIEFFTEYFSAATAMKIFQRFGENAVETVRRSPYVLLDNIQNIRFDSVDKMALDLGYKPDDEERVFSGVRHILNNALYQSGNCYIPEDILLRESSAELGIPLEKIASMMPRIPLRFGVVKRVHGGIPSYALTAVEEAERFISSKLHELTNESVPFRVSGIEDEIDFLEGKYGISYAEKQKEAIVSSVNNGVTVLTGGPGTGKTTVIKAIIDIFSSLKLSFALCAPTGRAAKRISEVSGGHEAKTIHRLLETSFDKEGRHVFVHNEHSPLMYKAVIVDEMSMVDVFLMQALLKAIKHGTYLILIGDSDQLPPVGAGNVLSDIISSGVFNVIKLNEIFRQAKESLVIMNAHRINSGTVPELDCRTKDFFFIEKHDHNEILQLISSLCVTRLPKRYGYDPLEDIQVVTPARKGPLGSNGLNNYLQPFFNPADRSKTEKKFGDTVFRVGDKVMQIKNDYDLEWEKDGFTGNGIFNGDIGIIKSIDPRRELMIIDFDGKKTKYDFAFLEELEHAYAVTVHKSQGSEYPVCIIPLFNGFPSQLMTRKILYTAVTRAKNMVILIGPRNAVSFMVANDRAAGRCTALCEYLKDQKN